MKKLIKNRQGDIPVMILVLVVITICGLAILSFIIFDQKDSKKDLGIEVIEELNSDIEKFYFYQDVFDDKNKAAEKLDGAIFNDNQLTIKKSNDVISVTYTKVYK